MAGALLLPLGPIHHHFRVAVVKVVPIARAGATINPLALILSETFKLSWSEEDRKEEE